MAVAQGYEKVPTNGLVFMYDVADSTSYKGEPTTNVAYAVNNNLNSGGNWWVNGGNATFNDNDTSISKPKISNVDTTNLYIFSSTVTGAGSNQQLGTSIIPISPSTTYSFSIWYYFTGTVMVVYPYIRTAVNNNDIGTFSYNGNTDGTTWPKNQWILLKATGTTQSNETGIYMSSYTGNAVGDKVYYFGYQVEQKDHCTPLVLGTRSTTQGLLPLVSNSTIELSNVTYDSNGQISLDGSNDYFKIYQNNNFYTNDWSWEMVVKFTSNTGTYQGLLWAEGATGGGSGYQYLLTLYNNAIFHYRIYNTSSGWNYTDTANITFDPLKYNHITWQFNNGTTSIYVNGVLFHTDTSRGAYSGGTNSPMFIGARNDGAYGAPIIPDICKFYNRTLTQEEVQQSYNKYKTRFNLS